MKNQEGFYVTPGPGTREVGKTKRHHLGGLQGRKQCPPRATMYPLEQEGRSPSLKQSQI